MFRCIPTLFAAGALLLISLTLAQGQDVQMAAPVSRPDSAGAAKNPPPRPVNQMPSPTNWIKSADGKLNAPIVHRKPEGPSLPDLKPEEPIITVNGDVLTWGAMKRHSELLLSQYRPPAGVTMAEFEEERDRLLMKLVMMSAKHYITKTVLAQEAKKRNLKVSDAEITAKRNELKARAKKETSQSDGYIKELDTPTSLLNIDTANVLWVSKLTESVIRPSIVITEEDITRYIEQRNQANEKINAYNANLRPRLAELLKRIKAGESFSEIASLDSDCGSSANGGEWGTFKREDLRPEIATVAFSMQEGDLSDIVETPFSCHILKLLKKNQAFQVAGVTNAAPFLSVKLAHIMLEKKKSLPALSPETAKPEPIEKRSKETLENLKTRLLEEATIETPLPLYDDDQPAK